MQGPLTPWAKKNYMGVYSKSPLKKCQVSMRYDMPRGFVRRVNIFDVCVVLVDEHVLMTTQHNNRRYLLLRSLIKHLLHRYVVRQRTHCRSTTKLKRLPMCVTSEIALQHCGDCGIFQ